MATILTNERSGLNTSEIVENLSLNKVHYYALIGCVLGFMFDGFDFFVVAYALPAIASD